MLTLDSKIEQIRKIGPVYQKRLSKLGIKTIRDLFFHFPRRYEDFSRIKPIDKLRLGEKAVIQGKIKQIQNTRTWLKKITITEALIQDDSGTIKAVWFNQPFLTNTLKPNKIVNLAGKITSKDNILLLSNPSYEIASPYKQPTHTGRLIPIYHETAGLSSRYLRFIIKPILNLANQFKDFLPAPIKKQCQLINLNQALKQIHFPDNLTSAQQARQRLAFDELFLIQLTTLLQKQKIQKQKAPAIKFNQKLIKSFVQKLPFKLTDSQRIAAWEILQDLQKEQPMNRLVNGDVGSGKTIIAIMAALQTAQAGYQTAIMAPTEILARQHFKNFQEFTKKQNLKIALITSSDNQISNTPIPKLTKAKERHWLKKQIKQGKADIIIGTHALIQEGLSFKNLSLVIIDEQHRFGVAQRAALQNKIYQIKDGLTTLPHFLSMTATPIPRTLTLTIYGDLDISLIKELPKGRKKIITRIIPPAEREQTYNFIKQQLAQKKQCFVICPLIDPSDKLGFKSVTQEYEILANQVFPEFKIAMLHGKLKPKQKQEVMDNFQKGETDILISTSVVEVGVDAPNANLMMIEGADRFGLAQLHQFRGRIGRGKDQAYCFLLTDSPGQKTNQRLKAIVKAKDGFELAEKDLKLRGPGEFIGSRQSGLPNLTMASLDDLDLIKKARQAAETTLRQNLLNNELQNKLKQFEKLIHLE